MELQQFTVVSDLNKKIGLAEEFVAHPPAGAEGLTVTTRTGVPVPRQERLRFKPKYFED